MSKKGGISEEILNCLYDISVVNDKLFFRLIVESESKCFPFSCALRNRIYNLIEALNIVVGQPKFLFYLS
jgi:hypothetical protein